MSAFSSRSYCSGGNDRSSSAAATSTVARIRPATRYGLSGSSFTARFPPWKDAAAATLSAWWAAARSDSLPPMQYPVVPAAVPDTSGRDSRKSRNAPASAIARSVVTWLASAPSRARSCGSVNTVAASNGFHGASR